MQQENAPRESFWKTIPGILTAIASLITAVGGFLLIVNQVGVCNRSKNTEHASREIHADSGSRPLLAPINPTAESKLSAISEGVTYTVLGVRKEAFSNTDDRLVLGIKVSASAGTGGLNYYAEYFRLEIDDVKTAPAASTSGHYVPENAEWKEDVAFIVPKKSTGGTLWVGYSGKSNTSPIALSW